MRIVTYVAAAAVLAACATPAERAAQAQRQMDEMIVTYGPACERLGYQANSDPWRDCVLRLNQQDTYERYRAYPTMADCFAYRGMFPCPMY
jgi:hypothetical protein